MTAEREPRHAHKEVRQVADWLKSVGFVFTGTDAKGHTIYAWGTGETIKLPSSPRGHVWVDNARKDAARIAGLDLANKRDAQAARDRAAVERDRAKVAAAARKNAALAALRERNSRVEADRARRVVTRRWFEIKDIQRLMRERPDHTDGRETA